MSFGIVEMISLLLGLSGFGLQNNPKAPTADQSLEYAIADADMVGHFDAASVVPGNYKLLTQLADQPQLKGSPELAKAVRQAVAEIEGPRGLVKGMTGIDVTSDVWDATAFLQLVPKHDPNVLVAVHGKFSTATVDKIAKLAGKVSVKAGAGALAETGDGNAIAVTKDGVLLFGTATIVKDRLADNWKSPAHGAGTNLGYTADVLGGKPVFAFVLTMSQSARAEALANLSGQNFATDMIKRHKVAAFAVYHDGIGWSWGDSSKPGLDAMAQISEGMVDMLRAAQIAPRGFAKIVLGGLESYHGVDKRVDEMLAHKADLEKLVQTYTGDGTFKVKLDKDPKSLRLDVRLSGKSLSDVIPVGVVLPMAGAMLVFRSATPTREVPQIAVPPPPSSSGKRTK